MGEALKPAFEETESASVLADSWKGFGIDVVSLIDAVEAASKKLEDFEKAPMVVGESQDVEVSFLPIDHEAQVVEFLSKLPCPMTKRLEFISAMTKRGKELPNSTTIQVRTQDLTRTIEAGQQNAAAGTEVVGLASIKAAQARLRGALADFAICAILSNPNVKTAANKAAATFRKNLRELVIAKDSATMNSALVGEAF